jgi:hypothetical protein
MAICARVTLALGQKRSGAQPPVMLAARSELIEFSPLIQRSSTK